MSREVDTFVLITTAELLPNPADLLTFSGVPSRGAGDRGPKGSPLAQLLYDVGQGTR